MNRGVFFKGSMCGQEEIEQLSRDGSHYSLSTGILPSLGARSNRRVKLRSFILSPYDRRYRLKNHFFSWFLFLGLFSFCLNLHILLSFLHCFNWFGFCVIWMIFFCFWVWAGFVEIWVYQFVLFLNAGYIDWTVNIGLLNILY